MILNILITILLIALSILVIYRVKMYRLVGISQHWMLAAWIFKLILASWMVFHYTQTEQSKTKADIFRFYEDSNQLRQCLLHEPNLYFKVILGIDKESYQDYPYYHSMNNWEKPNSILTTNNTLFISLLSLLSLLTNGSYSGMLVLIVFMSFTGLWWIYKLYGNAIKPYKKIIFILVFFTPSIAFWSSGLLKESFLFFFIGLVLNCGSQALKGHKPILRSIIGLLSLLAIFYLKAFVFLLIVPPLIAYSWNHFYSKQRKLIPYFILIFVSFSFASESHQYLPKGFFDLMIDKQVEFINLTNNEEVNSEISPILFEANSTSIALNSPIALINSLFKPMFWESNNLLMYLAAAENFLLFLSLILVIAYPKKQIEQANLLYFGLSFALSYFILIGLVTPVLGALSRYRTPALIFYELSLLLLIDIETIKQKLTNIIKH
jgi:hypothetical protein